jgi:hypothetical protein
MSIRRVDRYFKGGGVLLKINRKNYIQQNNNFTYTLLYKLINTFVYYTRISVHILLYEKVFKYFIKISNGHFVSYIYILNCV